MSRFKIVCIFIVFIFSPGLCIAQFSREQAVGYVLDQLLIDELDHINVYMAKETKSGQNGLSLGDATSISYPFISNWVFFIDDNPFAGWAHSCRYAFISSETGEVSTVYKDFFPDEYQSDFDLISSVPALESIPLDPDTNNAIVPILPNPHLYAVFICGRDEYIFWNDVSAVYSTLINYYGYSRDHIFVLYAGGPNSNIIMGNDLDGDLYCDIDSDAHKNTIINTFSVLQATLTPEDELFVFINDHGNTLNGNSYIYLPSNEHLYDTELASYVANINCSQMIYLLAQCYSGGFINDLMNITNVMCKNRYVYTAANDNELSYHERWITGGIHGNSGAFFEFVYYWNAAVRGWYPSTTEPWNSSFHPVGSFLFSDYFKPPECQKPHPPDWNPDSDIAKGGNNDGIIQMREAFNYADSMDTYSPNGYYNLCGDCGTDPEHPQTSESMSNGNGNGGFRDNVVGLTGLIGHMNTSQSVDGNRNYLVGGPFTVDINNTLDIGQNTTFYLKNNLHVNGSISIADNFTVFGISEPNADLNGFHVNGAIQLGSNSNFNNCSFIVGLPTTSLSLNYATFNNSYIHPWAIPEMHINWSNFNNCGVILTGLGNVSYDNSFFVNTSLCLANYGPANSNVAIVQNCNFLGSSGTTYLPAVDIGFYSNYHVFANTICNYDNGISLNSCGKQHGELYQTVENNHISNCVSSGIQLYYSSGELLNNHIFNNAYGIRLMNTSYFAVDGSSTATFYWNTQNIKNNSSFQVFADRYSFPYSFHYNIIHGNGQDPWIFWDRDVGPPKMNISNNCWGDHFVPSNVLYPWENYAGYEIVWCPDGGTPPPSDPPLPDILFNNAEEAFINEDYINAKEIFKSIIFIYPNTKEAEESLKELFRLEYFTENNYQNLKEYYLSNDTIISYPSLKVLGDFLANRCDVINENWENVINWYENKIQNPCSIEDSIYSIIDLGYVYLLMDSTNLKSSQIGTFPQYKPKNMISFIPHRDSLLKLVPGKHRTHQLIRNIFSLRNGELIQNVPNPFTNETEILFKLDKECEVSVVVSNSMNKEIKKIKMGTLDAGNHTALFNLNDLPSGLYFYSLYIDDIQTDIKKMVKR